MRRWLGRVWAAIRQILEIHDLLDWVGWWRPLVVALISSASVVWGYVKKLAGPELTAIFLVVFAAIVVLWRAISMAKSGQLWRQDFQASMATPSATLEPKLIRGRRSQSAKASGKNRG
jgi:hypothetical protein